MPTTTAPPILIWQPGGGTPIGPVSNPPVYSQADVTQLVIGQAYVDVVFGSVQTDNNWVLVECDVVNTTDLSPLNIWPGLITNRTTAGFRVWLNGMPDTGNYYLHWAVSGVNIQPIAATLYLFTGPTSGPYDPITGHSSIFTVSLPPSTMLPFLLTITPNDSGAGGTFSPTSVVLSTGSASATFTYVPASYGPRTLSVTNSSTLTDPAGIVFTAVAAAYTLSGPSGGNSGVPSTNFTAALPVGGVVSGTVTVTPNDSVGGGVFTPTTVNLTTVAPSATFTYTPASNGTKTISVTNNGGLTNPGSISYVASTPFDPTTIAGLKLWLKADAIPGPPADGTPIGSWGDSSGGTPYALTNTGGAAAPKFKTSIVNALPVIRFDGVANYLSNNTLPTVAQPTTIFVVGKQAVAGTNMRLAQGVVGAVTQIAYLDTSGFFSIYAGSAVVQDAVNRAGAFHVFTAIINGASSQTYVDGSLKASGNPGTGTITGVALMYDSGSSEHDAGDYAELLIYNTALSSTDRGNVEAYLKSKYAIP